jgi:hypothetical protein
VALSKLDVERPADGSRGALNGVELDFVIVGIEQSVELGAAGFHALRHRVFAELLRGHALGDLPGEDALDGLTRGFIADSFLLEEVIERRPDVCVFSGWGFSFHD